MKRGELKQLSATKAVNREWNGHSAILELVKGKFFI